MLSNEDRNKIIFDRLSFDVHIKLDDGELLEKTDGYYVVADTLADETPVVVPYDQLVTLSFNEKTYERFAKYVRIVHSQRGIKNPDEIDENDYAVKTMIANARRKNKNKPLDDGRISAIIEQVKREHKPHTMLATFQVLMWSMLYNNLFQITGKNSLECRLDITIPDSYWDGPETEIDPLDAILNLEKPIAPFIDRNQHLEVMLALSTSMQNQFPAFNETSMEYVRRAFSAIGLITGDQQYDDAGFLNSRLDKLLSQ